MLKICAAALLAILCCTGAASAHGGGAAEAMPSTNFTEMPNYSPQRMSPVRVPPAKRGRWRQGFARDR